MSPILDKVIEIENLPFKKQVMVFLYACEKGLTLIKSLRKDLQRTLPSNIKVQIIYTETKLSSQFSNVKDRCYRLM